MPKVPIDKLRFLTFEGGGGKGTVYLGPIQALESKDLNSILPIRPGGQIQGISGASAGAITALLLTIGLRASEIEKLLDNTDFNTFFDPPVIGVRRAISDRNAPLYLKDDAINQKVNTLKNDLYGGYVVRLIRTFNGTIMEWVGPELSPILKALMEDLDGSLYCICFDRGFFLGRTIREFFERVLDAYLKRIGKETLQREKINHDGGFLTFSELKRLSKIDLVITGTNITLSEPLCFSEKITPNFPVAEAVAISMNLPILFKPIVVKSQVPVTEEDEFLKGISPDGFKGEWVDGGLLNNLPLHVFDHIGFEDPTKPVPLNPNIVAFRLFGGYDPNRAGRFLNTPWGKIDLDAKPDKPLGIFFGFLASLFDTLLSPSGKGQLRNWREKDQTVQFFTDRLSTLEFSPSRSKRDDPIRAARKATIDYFKSERKK